MTDEQQQQELSAKQAVRRAMQEVHGLFEDTPVDSLLLEEIERSGPHWLVTVSFTRPGRATGIGAIMAPEREYKRVRIDAADGTLQGIEIRTLPAPPKPERSYY